MAEDKQAQQAVENVDTSTRAANKPAAGPHAREISPTRTRRPEPAPCRMPMVKMQM
jgi:hypothetical protein